MFPNTAHKVYPFRPLQHDNLANQPVNRHILPVLVLVEIFNSHMILHLLFRFSIEGDTKMCVTDYCPHSYSYRMILIRTHFIFISLARFCIWYTVLEITIELVRIFDTNKQESESKWLFSLLFARRKNLISVSSFACWNCPLPQTCLACACRHCRLVFNGMLFLYSLLNLSASLLPSIERQVALFIVVWSWKTHHQQ